MLNLVGGEWRDASGSIDVLDPSDEREVVASVPAMDAADVEAAFAAAAAGAATWRATSSVDRGRILLRAADLLRERAPEIARVLTREMGKTLAEATAEVGKAADFFEYYGGLGRGARGELIAHERADVTAYTVHEPLGVVLAITPWNDPLLTPARKLAPALIAGNSVVLKPATYTPLVALELARALDDAGLPAGVVNTVTGNGAAIGHALISQPSLAAVSFTGSNEVGAELRKTLAVRDIPLLAELGGKNAAIVLADAPVDLAAASIAAAGWAQAGQRCTATSRVIVERPLLEPLVEELRRRAEAFVVGPGLEPGTTFGPLVSGSQRDSVLGFVERAVAEGAEVVVGGGAPEGEDRAHGCYVSPTLLVDVSPDSEIWTEEVFGPVIAVVAADDEAHALELLNGSRYGLAAALYARDIGAIGRFVAGADVGQVAVNLPTSGWDVHMPFGGAKVSGSGHKEQGLEGLHFYTRTKTVAIAP
ncbi:MAG: aldehyde dehydrogenase [Actinobacteria bacterium]|nr:aldehyde dehydrogenase [Actinomycetota bacterium]